MNDLRLDQKTPAPHLLGLFDAHGVEDGGCNVSKDTLLLLEAPALRGVGKDEGNLVGRVGGLGSALLVEHLLRVTGKKMYVSPGEKVKRWKRKQPTRDQR